MKVTHFSNGNALSKKVEQPIAFILVNDRKDFATFYGTPQSRYEGFFVAHGDTFIKTVSRIMKSGTADGLDLYHDKALAAFHYGRSPMLYHVVKDEPVLICERSAKDSLIVRLDMRDQFHIPIWGRNYDYYEDEKVVVVQYSDDRIAEPVFLAILHDGTFRPISSWVPIDYERDMLRNSSPTTVYEYDLGEFKTKKLVFAFGKSGSEAVERARRYAGLSMMHVVSQNKVKPVRASKNTAEIARKIGLSCAERALDELFTGDAMLAGMPWFTKAWVRDELISLPAYPKARARAIVSKYINADWNGGRFPVIFGGSNYCSDGLGLLAWAILFCNISLSEQEKGILSSKVSQAISALEALEDENGFVPSWERESWMDSIGRVGYPVETQALYCKIIQLAHFLTGDDYYAKKRFDLINNIRTCYFTDGYLHDRLYDETIRPNVFLAAMFEPDILSDDEWEMCFDKVLPPLWLDWGGLSSVDMQHECFCDISAGEFDTSYHNGDSWFFVNNIAALVMQNVNAKKYRKYIDGILDASTEEILWHNYAGQPGEISSARALESWGCGLQGFSSAAYVYLANSEPIRRHPLISLSSVSSNGKKGRVKALL